MGFALASKAVGAAGTRERLSDTDLRVSQVLIQAKRANTGRIYVGDSTVTSTLAVELVAPAVNTQLPSVNLVAQGGSNGVNLKDLWIDAEVSGNGVNLFYEVF